MSLSVPAKSTGDDTSIGTRMMFSKDVFFGMLIKKILNGNIIHDAVIYFIANLIYAFMERTTPEIFKNMDTFYLKFVTTLMGIVKKLKSSRELTNKVAMIKYITDNNDINLLFEHVLWYLNTHTETKKEEKTSFQIIKNTPDLTRQVPLSKLASIEYKGNKIEYQVNTELITIHAEREYKRDNRSITLTTRVREDGDFLDEFCQHCVTEHKNWLSKREWTQSIFRNTSEGKWTESKSKFLRSTETVILKEGQMESIVNDVSKFIEDEEWYGERNVPWTKRFLFYGPTGTGKSSTIKAIASRFKRNIHFLLLSQIKSDESLLKLLENIDYKTTIIVIEDIDCAVDPSVTHSRVEPVSPTDSSESKEGEESETKEKNLSMAGLLNAIDGQMIDTYGQILIITTNHLEKLDDALVRPGRVDRKIKFGNTDSGQIKGLYYNFFKIIPNGDYIFPDESSPSSATIFSILLDHKDDKNKAWDTICRQYGIKNIQS